MGAMSALPDVPSGARWRCVDTHLHSPGVPTFALPGGVDIRTAEGRAGVVDEYVEALRTAGIDVGVITDYQGVRTPWFMEIRDRAAELGIEIWPGAELSLDIGRGLHLLVVCSPSTAPEEINEAVRHLDRDGQALFKDRDLHREVKLGDTSLEKALDRLRTRLDCAVIAAHAEDSKGIFSAKKAEDVAALVSAGLLDAFDKCDASRDKLKSTGRLSQDQVDRIACIMGSDPKKIDDIGRKATADGRPRATWIKLSHSSAAAMRLSLHDPRTRVLSREPGPIHHPRVLSLEVSGGGFLDGLSIRFNDDLTVLIGGRGAGKSAVLEVLRYTLDAEPYIDHSERLSLVRHAMGSGGRSRVIIERPGPETAKRYEITRVLDQRVRVVDSDTGVAINVPPMELFGAGGSPVILLQREIQAVARDDGFRRRLLDEIIGDEARTADQRVLAALEQLRTNQRAIENLERQLDQRTDREERLTKVSAEIDYYDKQGLSDKLLRRARSTADEARLASAGGHFGDLAEGAREWAAFLADHLGAAQAELRAGESEDRAALEELAAATERLQERATEWALGVQQEVEKLKGSVEQVQSTWHERIAPLTAALHESAAELGVDAVTTERYLAAVGEQTALRPIVAAYTRQVQNREGLLGQRAELLRTLQDRRRAAFDVRRRAVDQVNVLLAKRLRMQVTYLGSRGDFRTRLAILLRGSRVSSDAVDTLTSGEGVDGFELAQTVQKGEAALVTQYGVTQATAERLATWLTDDPARIRELETLAPQDDVSISLVMEDGRPRDLAMLSGGQKATAMLLLLFAQPRRPLILDQPEDDLDNRFVYDDVVALLRDEKGVVDPDRRRQIIAATHNANIPVNGDAELVLSLADEDGHCRVKTRASIDDPDVRREIRRVLEGGAEAFRRRAEKYGGLDDA